MVPGGKGRLPLRRPRCTVDLAGCIAGASDVLGADVPRVDLGLDGEDEGQENGNDGRELHVDWCRSRSRRLGKSMNRILLVFIGCDVLDLVLL